MYQEYAKKPNAGTNKVPDESWQLTSARLSFLLGTLLMLIFLIHHKHGGFGHHFGFLSFFIFGSAMYVVHFFKNHRWKTVNLLDVDFSKGVTLNFVTQESIAKQSAFKEKSRTKLERVNRHLDPYGLRIIEKNLNCTIQARVGVKNDIEITARLDPGDNQHTVQISVADILLLEVSDYELIVHESKETN